MVIRWLTSSIALIVIPAQTSTIARNAHRIFSHSLNAIALNMRSFFLDSQFSVLILIPFSFFTSSLCLLQYFPVIPIKASSSDIGTSFSSSNPILFPFRYSSTSCRGLNE